MKLAKVIGSVTATAKDAQLSGQKMLVCDVVDGSGTVIDPAVVAVDTVGAGAGSMVLLTFGSAARLPTAVTGKPVDATIIAIVDDIRLG